MLHALPPSFCIMPSNPAISASKITSVMKCVEFLCTGTLKTHHQYPLEQPRIVRSNKWLWQFKLSLMGIMGVGRVLRQVNIVSKHSCPGVSNSPKLRSICCFQDPTVKNWQSNSRNSNRGQFRWVEVSLDPLSGPRVKFQHKIIFQSITCHLPQNLTLSLVK